MAQLRHYMSKQAEVLIKGKQQTEGTLHSLRRQVDALGELVTSTYVDPTSLSPSGSQLESLFAEDSQLGQSQSFLLHLWSHGVNRRLVFLCVSVGLKSCQDVAHVLRKNNTRYTEFSEGIKLIYLEDR
ncbi:centriolin-like [Tamandua tetradactyla]|uniref:centriolin-like n=1 Tax=Tamandua tetradactyla TaxID=48850 RepID=UPI0040538E8B